MIRWFLTLVMLASCGAIELLAQQPIANDRLSAIVAQFGDAAVAIRREIHQNPELGNREFKTAALVASSARIIVALDCADDLNNRHRSADVCADRG